MSVLPISAERAADLNGIFSAIDFEDSQSIVVAVSGGSDSLALLFLLREYCSSRPGFPEIVAVTVDHGLRPESGDEANYVGELCRKAGITHRILKWRGEKPRTGLSASAREARYRLLCDAACDAGAGMIFTGHTLDDQVETYLMRSARSIRDGSERGQAGMAQATLLEASIWLLRPLLGTRREELRDYLRKLGVVWRDDPSNESSKYERVRVRKSIQRSDLTQLCREIDTKATKRRRLNAEVAAQLPGCATIAGGIRVQINREGWEQLAPEVQQLAIGTLLAAMGGQSFLPAAASCQKALEFMRGSLTYSRLALGRCIIQTGAETIMLYREMRSIPAINAEPGMSVLWDGRYRVTNRGKHLLVIAACGTKGLDQLKIRPEDFHGPSAMSSPAVSKHGKTVYLPAFDDHGKLPEGVTIERRIGLFDKILVGYDELLAQCIAGMFKMQAYKRSPVNQINKN
jgi:tRNA(Ile)-lysidine synthase